MDMFNKLRSTVSTVLPVGNPVSKDFEIKTHRASGGPGLLWKIHDACNRKTKQEASVFIFEKKALERYSRRDRDCIIDTLRKGATQLTKLRHPNILSVLHPLEDSRESLAFATEPVFASLANVLGQQNNTPNPLPADLEGYKLYDVEIKYGLLQLCEGLGFLHSGVKLVHRNVCPDSVMINKAGSWKLAGFDFCVANANQADQMPFYPHKEWLAELPPVVQPQLNYYAPEYALTMSCDTSSDMFSVGVLFYAVFNFGKPLFDSKDDWTAYTGNVEALRRVKSSLLGNVPEDVREHASLLLNTEPSVRPDADQLAKIPFFEDVGAMTLQYLDSLFQRDNLQKSQFFKGLPKVLSKLPKRVNLQRILPPLFTECVNKDMVPFVLPCVLMVAEQATQGEYVRCILPGLVPLFKFKEPVQILLIFMQNMTLLLQKTPQSDIKTHVLPMVYGALESNSPQIQELCLNIIPTFAILVDYTAMKNSLMPRIKRLCLGTSLLNVRVTSLICIGKLLEFMDKWFVLDDILPLTMQIPSREPAVLMSLLGIYKVVLTHSKLGITKDILANKVIPFLFPIAIDNNLNLQQFNAYMSVIKEMIDKVEAEHKQKLEQLNSMQAEQRTIQLNSLENSGSDQKASVGGGGATVGDSMMDKLMTGFGLSSYFKASSGTSSTSNGTSGGTPSAITANGSVPEINSIPTPTPNDTRLPNQPAKVSLSLEEKARLAKEQEQQQRYKSQASIQPQALQAASKNTPVKDLTSSLLTSNLLATQNTTGSTNKPSPRMPTASTSVFGASTAGTGGYKPMNSPVGLVFGTTTNTASSMGSVTGMPQPAGSMSNSIGGFFASKTNTSSFDDLPSNTKPKMNLNQMNQTQQVGNVGNRQEGLLGMTQQIGMGGGSVGSTGFSSGNMSQKPMIGGGGGIIPSQGSSAEFGQGMMGNQQSMMVKQGVMGNQQSMMGTQGMMGNQQSMMGTQGMMGNQQSMMGTQSMRGSQQGMMGAQNMMGNLGNQFGNQMVGGQNQQNTSNSKSLSSSEIDALLR